MAGELARYRCERCGACCTHLVVYARADDVLREPRLAEAGVRIDCPDAQSLARTQWRLSSRGPCPFLTPQGCGIYPTRPRDCLGFPPGSTQCAEAREAAGLQRLQPMPPTIERTLIDHIYAAALAADAAVGNGTHTPS